MRCFGKLCSLVTDALTLQNQQIKSTNEKKFIAESAQGALLALSTSVELTANPLCFKTLLTVGYEAKNVKAIEEAAKAASQCLKTMESIVDIDKLFSLKCAVQMEASKSVGARPHAQSIIQRFRREWGDDEFILTLIELNLNSADRARAESCSLPCSLVKPHVVAAKPWLKSID